METPSTESDFSSKKPDPAASSEPVTSLQGDDFINNLLSRNQSLSAPGNILKPRLHSRFEPDGIQSDFLIPDFPVVKKELSQESQPAPSQVAHLQRKPGDYLAYLQTQPVSTDRQASELSALRLLEQISTPFMIGSEQEDWPDSSPGGLLKQAQLSAKSNPLLQLPALDGGDSLNNQPPETQPGLGPSLPTTGLSVSSRGFERNPNQTPDGV